MPTLKGYYTPSGLYVLSLDDDTDTALLEQAENFVRLDAALSAANGARPPLAHTHTEADVVALVSDLSLLNDRVLALEVSLSEFFTGTPYPDGSVFPSPNLYPLGA